MGAGSGTGLVTTLACSRKANWDVGDARCANCNGLGHTARDCKKPRLAMTERRCHVCSKTGHLAAKCLEKDKANAAAVSQARPPKAITDRMVCVIGDADGFTAPRRTIKPSPHVVTIGDFPVAKKVPQGAAKRGGAPANRECR